MFHKKGKPDWCRRENFRLQHKKELTSGGRMWYAEYVGAVEKTALFA
jgi:hypothetical protein